MTKQFQVSREETRAFAEDILKSQLDFYSGKIIVAAEAEQKTSKFDPYMALAANGLRLLSRLPAKLIILDSLEQRGSVDVVEAVFPQIIKRNEQEWRLLAESTWEAVQFEPGVNSPVDRSLFGHIELINALSQGKAKLQA